MLGLLLLRSAMPFWVWNENNDGEYTLIKKNPDGNLIDQKLTVEVSGFDY